MTKAYVEQHEEAVDDKAISRIVNAVKKYAPSKKVKFVSDIDEADLIFYYVTGRLEYFTERVKRDGKPYVIVQLALRTTQKPHTDAWLDLWRGANLVSSYLNLKDCIRLDDSGGDLVTSKNINILHSPLGVENASLSIDSAPQKDYDLCVVGRGYLTESVRECVHAVRRCGMKMAYIGSKIEGIDDVCDQFESISDDQLFSIYGRSRFVAGLRRHEGFELPCAEGLLCGAKPIVFDTVNYRHWYDGLAIMIEESSREQIIEDLMNVLTLSYDHVSYEDKLTAYYRFDWEQIVKNLWGRILVTL